MESKKFNVHGMEGVYLWGVWGVRIGKGGWQEERGVKAPWKTLLLASISNMSFIV